MLFFFWVHVLLERRSGIWADNGDTRDTGKSSCGYSLDVIASIYEQRTIVYTCHSSFSSVGSGCEMGKEECLESARLTHREKRYGHGW